MTELYLSRNMIGDRGASAMAEALKAKHVIRFRNTRAIYSFADKEGSSEVLEAFDFSVERKTLNVRIVVCSAHKS